MFGEFFPRTVIGPDDFYAAVDDTLNWLRDALGAHTASTSIYHRADAPWGVCFGEEVIGRAVMGNPDDEREIAMVGRSTNGLYIRIPHRLIPEGRELLEWIERCTPLDKDDLSAGEILENARTVFLATECQVECARMLAALYLTQHPAMTEDVHRIGRSIVLSILNMISRTCTVRKRDLMRELRLEP